MEKRSRRRVRDLVALPAFQGLSQNEIGCARISMMARSTNAPFKGRIQKRKTNHLQIITFGLQRTAGPYKSARTGHSLPAFFATLGTPNAPTAAVLYCATGPASLDGFRGIADMIVGTAQPCGVARSVSVDCPFQTHAHVLVWSYWPSVRYCG